jgi:predicted nucleic acid-binding Zn finger protein
MMVEQIDSLEKEFRMIVYRISDVEFAVLSLNSTFGKPRQYTVKRNCYKWLCTCPDYQKHSTDLSYVCKHIEAVFKASAINMSEIEVVRRYNE